MNARLGPPTAITAPAHQLARWIETRLKDGTASGRQHLADDEQPYRNRMVQHLTRRAKAVGDAVVTTPEGTPAESSRP